MKRAVFTRKFQDEMRLLEESVIVICPNPKCGRNIEEPILLTNLSVKPTEQYDACPYCFTKLIPETPVELEEVTPSEKDEILETSTEDSSQVLKKVEDLILGSSENKEKEDEKGCPEKFGYLANRPKEAPIPPDCLLCPKMVDCMLRAKE
jgi:hypothetical protein